MSLIQSFPSHDISNPLCPRCGSEIFHAENDGAQEAQRRILELEAQVRLLNTKAASAADKLADYEDELQALHANVQNPRASVTSSSGLLSPPLENGPRALSQTHSPPPLPSTQHSSRLPSLSSLLPGRRPPAATSPQPTSNLLHPHHPSNLALDNTSTHSLPAVLSSNNNSSSSNDAVIAQPSSSLDSQSETLHSMLEAEKKARLAAESSLSEAHSELEELTTQLFSQANEMVADERKARAKLEARIKMLEERDGEKRRRLDMLEKAVFRIERVRGMIG